MPNQHITRFSGMLNQHELKERYIFIKQCRENGFSREDIAFLLGRSSYHIIDYEGLSTHIKMDYMDHEVMAELFKTLAPRAPAFDYMIDKHNISHEKRLIRGTYTSSEKGCLYQFNHPWTIKGINKPIVIDMKLCRDYNYDEQIRLLLKFQLNKLIKLGYFDHKCAPIKIYDYIYSTIQIEWCSLFTPLLKQVVYDFIRNDKLIPLNESGHIFYQIKL